MMVPVCTQRPSDFQIHMLTFYLVALSVLAVNVIILVDRTEEQRRICVTNSAMELNGVMAVLGSWVYFSQLCP
jgi:hypothetical protein